MKKTYCLLTVAMLCVMASCTEDPLANMGSQSGSEKPTKPGSSKDESITTSSLTSGYDWWTFFPRSVVADRYNVSYGPDGISWPGLENCSGLMFFPDYIRTAHLNDVLYMLYFYNGSYYLKTSTDGRTWSSAVLQSNIVNSQSATGARRYPEIAAVNGELYLFQFVQLYASEINSMVIKTYKYSNGAFSSIATSSILPPDIDNYISDTPSFAQAKGKYFLFANTGATTISIISADIVNWTLDRASVSYPNNPETDTEAVAFNDVIYVTYISNIYPGYIRYGIYHDNDNDGSWVWENVEHSIDVARSSGKNVPIATDGTKMVVNFRGAGGNDYNYVAYTTVGEGPWTVKRIGGSSLGGRYRELIYTGD